MEIDKYRKGFGISDLFITYSMGIASARDSQLIKFTKLDIDKFANDFAQLEKREFLQKNNFPKETEDWNYDNAKKDLAKANISLIFLLWISIVISNILQSLHVAWV